MLRSDLILAVLGTNLSDETKAELISLIVPASTKVADVPALLATPAVEPVATPAPAKKGKRGGVVWTPELRAKMSKLAKARAAAKRKAEKPKK